MIKKNGHIIIGAAVASALLLGCGSAPSVSETKIVGGSLVDTDDAVYKHTVALVDPTGQQFCTGTLVTSTWVVTAAHCLQGYRDDSLFVAFGKKAVLGSFTADKLRSAIFAKVHEDYDENAMAQEEATSPPADLRG